MDKRQGFSGPIKQLATDEEIKAYVVERRKKIMKDQSTFFTYTVEGKNIYEFHEDEDTLENNLNHYETEKEKLNVRFRSLVDIGNPDSDPFNGFLEVGKTYQAVVLGVDDLKRYVLVTVGGTRAIIPESGFSWAHKRKIDENPTYHISPKHPSKILKRGDIILVSIEQKNVGADQLIHEDFFKRYKDASLRGILGKQKFFRASLDQEPEAEGALIAINSHNGEIISLVGGTDFQKSQFNRVTQSSRQPGSAFKPFIYAAALENGYTPSSILMDSPQALGGVDDSLSWKPRNYDGEFRGPMTFRRALEVSRNIPTVRLVQDLGVSKIHNFVKRFHLNAEIPRDMSLSLGSFGISLAELTKGFAVFPNGGRAIRLQHILSIKDRYGKSYPIPSADAAWPPEEPKAPRPEPSELDPTQPQGNPFHADLSPVQVYDKRLAYVMTNLLKGVALYGTAAKAGAELGPNIGGKTGTTNNYVDALFVGFSNNLVVGTWAGFDDNRTLGFAETGTRTALPMWMDYMNTAINKYGVPEFNVPDGITSVLINKETGKPLPEGSTDGFLESYVFGTEPNAEHSLFDPEGLERDSPGTSFDDDDYFMNQ